MHQQPTQPQDPSRVTFPRITQDELRSYIEARAITDALESRIIDEGAAFEPGPLTAPADILKRRK